MALRSNGPGTPLVARYFCDSAEEWSAAGPEGVLRVQGVGGTVAVAMDGKADSAMDVEAFGPAEAEAFFPGREGARAAEAAGTFVAWGGRPALGTGPASPGPNAREWDLEEPESPEDTQGSFENEARVVCQGSEARVDKVQPETDEATSTSESADTLEEWATSAPAAFSNAVVRYYVTDHLGSPRVVLDAQRQVLDRHDYEPFGVELTPFTDQADLTHRFTGHERDLQTGYDYMHFRFYGSNMGRFLKPDNIPGALTDPQSWNLYAYVRNNPANATDPTGHVPQIYGIHAGTPGNSLQALMGFGGEEGDDEVQQGHATLADTHPTVNQYLAMFNTSALDSSQIRLFNMGILSLYATGVGSALLNNVFDLHVPISITSMPKADNSASCTTTPTYRGSKITGFEIRMNFTGAGAWGPKVGTFFGVEVKAPGLFGGYKAKVRVNQFAEALGHELRHVTFDMQNPAEAIEFEELRGRGAYMPTAPDYGRYKVLQNFLENPAYSLQQQLNSDLRGGN